MIYSTLYLRSCSNGYRRKEEHQLHGRHFVRCLLDTKLNALADKIESVLVKTWWNWGSKQSSFRRILYTLHHHFTLFMYFTLFFNLLYLVLCTLLGNHSVEYITLHIAFAGTSYSIMLIHLLVEPACQWYVTSNVSSSFVVHSLIIHISVELGKLHAFQHFFCICAGIHLAVLVHFSAISHQSVMASWYTVHMCTHLTHTLMLSSVTTQLAN